MRELLLPISSAVVLVEVMHVAVWFVAHVLSGSRGAAE